MNSKSDYRQTKGGRDVIIFAYTLTGKENDSREIVCPKVARFLPMSVCLKLGTIAKPLYIRINNYGLGLLWSCVNYVIFSNRYLLK